MWLGLWLDLDDTSRQTSLGRDLLSLQSRPRLTDNKDCDDLGI